MEETCLVGGLEEKHIYRIDPDRRALLNGRTLDPILAGFSIVLKSLWKACRE